MGGSAKSRNFGFLKHLDPSLVALAAQAELLFTIDEVACLMRLRLLGERLVRELAAHAGVHLLDDASQLEAINVLRSRGFLHSDVAKLFHALRTTGNTAIHEGVGTRSEALHQLKMCRRMGVAVLGTLAKLPDGFKLGPFIPPAAPQDASHELAEELEALRVEAAKADEARSAALEAAEFEKELREDYEKKLAELREQVKATEKAFDELVESRDQEMAALLAKVDASTPQEQKANEALIASNAAAQRAIFEELTEDETRELIDRQLRDAGWEANSLSLRYSLGSRPQKGKNLAIAEWKTTSGPADYALFVGLKLVGIVEAKRHRKSAAGALTQARRYSRDTTLDGAEPAGGPWGEGSDVYKVPFLFATNGRPFLKQIIDESGIWFQDVRRASNLPRALVDWYTPEGLTKLLAQDHDDAHAKLDVDPVTTLGLRYYQEDAIRAVEKAIAKNELRPTIAVTVDLLTTGIDVPAISNLVFLRRVRSRILYEQMLGRATRLCPEIDKEVFRIYDAVDLYAALKDMTDMKPVATQRIVTFEKLVAELCALTDEEARDEVLSELMAKLQRKKKRLEGDAAELFKNITGKTVPEFLKKLGKGNSEDAAKLFASLDELAPFLDRKIPSQEPVLISKHKDKVIEVSRGYGEGRKRPKDYLESFEKFVRENMNTLPALIVVTQRPKDLTRAELKALKLALDKEKFDEPQLRTAWRETSNVDIAASIIGYIRQAALGEALMPYEKRVDAALETIIASQKWKEKQLRWLKRIAEQMKATTVVDRESLDQEPFADHGGFKRLNKLFDGKLQDVLERMGEAVWEEGA